MHRLSLVLAAALLAAACADQPTSPDTLRPTAPRLESGSGSGSSGSGSGGGGTTTTTGPIQNVFFNNNPIVAGDTSSVLVSFNPVAPAGGYTIALRSNDPAMQVPATFAVPPGALAVHVPLSTTPIVDARVVSVTVTLNGQSKSNSVKLFPRTATLAAPQLLSPSNGANFGLRRIVDFDWNDQNNAWCYLIQIDDDPAFTGSPAYAQVCTPNSFFRQSAFGPSGSTAYWRVAALDASLNPGPWSPVRSIRIQ